MFCFSYLCGEYNPQTEVTMANVEFAQVVSHGCGMDIHKEVVVATVRTPEFQETREFKTFTSSLTEMGEWLKSLKVTHVAMESTGVYWKPIYNVLESYIPNIWIVNARHIKNVPGHKTDKMDSEWICKLLMAGLLKNSYIPPKAQRELRDLTRYRRKLIQAVSADKNRIVRVLEDGNIKLSSVLSSTSGVTAEKLIAMLCSGRKITMNDVMSVYHKRIQASPEDILEACTGTLTRHQIFMLQLIQSNISSTKENIAILDQQIRAMLAPYDNAMEALAGIPGIERKVAEDLVAEIGLDMTKFPSEKHLASWAGICPGNNESAGKKKLKNEPWQQTGKSGNYRSRVGSVPYQKYVLQREIPPNSSPKRKEACPYCSRPRTTDSRVHNPKHWGNLQGVGQYVCANKAQGQTNWIPHEGTAETGV